MKCRVPAILIAQSAVLALAATLLSAGATLAQTASPAAAQAGTPGAIALPGPDATGKVTLERAIAQRRSVREYAPGALSLAEVSQLMWVAQGITGPDGKRATPSARAVYPLQVWLVANDVKGLAPGIYRYAPKEHALAPVAGGTRDSVVAAARGQASVKQAAAVVAVIGDSALAATKFRGNAERWLGMEAGFIVQDVYLECTALGLGTVMVGGFVEPAARVALGTPEGWQVLALMPVGRRK
jgi:SagB-type dehydrogenase family enzyme